MRNLWILPALIIMFFLISPVFAFETVPGLRYYQNSFSASDQTDTVVRTPSVGSNIAVYAYSISSNSSTTFTWILTDAQRGGSTSNGVVHHITSDASAIWTAGNAPAFTGDMNEALSFTYTTVGGNGELSLSVSYQEIP